jgi:hypothetical protein
MFDGIKIIDIPFFSPVTFITYTLAMSPVLFFFKILFMCLYSCACMGDGNLKTLGVFFLLFLVPD